jgi:hypothetical protein
MASIAAFQAVDPGSIPGQRNFSVNKKFQGQDLNLDLPRGNLPLWQEYYHCTTLDKHEHTHMY